MKMNKSQAVSLSLFIAALIGAFLYMRSLGTVKFTQYAQVFGSLSAVFASIQRWIKYRAAQKHGVSKEEFLLTEAGGPEGLLKKSRQARNLGFALFGITLLVPVFAWQMPLALRIVLTGVLGIILVPVGLLLLWSSRKSRRIAESRRYDGSMTSA